MTGAGLSVDAYWSSENDYYATGRLSLTDYDIDLSSNTIGRLKSNGDANGQSVHVEAGRRMALNEQPALDPASLVGPHEDFGRPIHGCCGLTGFVFQYGSIHRWFGRDG